MVAPGCTKRAPWPASMMPAAMRSRLDLPEPLRPTKHTRSPAETASSAPCSNGVPPKVSAILLSCRRGGDRAIEARVRRRDGSIAQQPRPVLLPGGPHPQGREARQPSGPGADEVRVGDQPYDCEGAWPYNTTLSARSRRRGDRIGAPAAKLVRSSL